MSSVQASQGPVFPSPRVRAHDRIAAQTAAGSISTTDQTALDTAVDSIDAALKGSDSGRAPSQTPLDPSDLKARIDGLIGQQVQNGALTSDQATTLKSVLGGDSGGSSITGADGRSGGHHHGGPPPVASEASSSDPQATTGSTAQSTNDLLATFVKQLQSLQGQTSPYGAGGSRATPTSASSLLMNFKV